MFLKVTPTELALPRASPVAESSFNFAMHQIGYSDSAEGSRDRMHTRPGPNSNKELSSAILYFPFSKKA